MEFEARRFARKVLMIHLALMLLVVIIVTGAGWLLYVSARTQAIEQAKQTQELLAKQTALGVENYYESVTGVMNLLQPAGALIAMQSTTDPSAADLLKRR